MEILASLPETIPFVSEGLSVYPWFFS